jgi:hypothetical protein
MYKPGNALNYAPKSVQAQMKQAMHEIWQAEIREAVDAAFGKFMRSGR